MYEPLPILGHKSGPPRPDEVIFGVGKKREQRRSGVMGQKLSGGVKIRERYVASSKLVAEREETDLRIQEILGTSVCLNWLMETKND